MSSKKSHTALTPELIEKYLKGELSHAQMHEVERLMLDSEFEAEAMEGFESSDAAAIPDDLAQLKHRIDERVNAGKKTSFLWVKIAACIVLLAISTFLILNLEFKNNRKEIAKSSEKSVLNKDSANQQLSERNSISDSLLAINKGPTNEEEQPDTGKNPAPSAKKAPASNSTQPAPESKPDQVKAESMALADVDLEIAEEAESIKLEDIQDEGSVEAVTGFNEPGALQQKIKKAPIAKGIADRPDSNRSLQKAAVASAAGQNIRTLTGTVTSADDGSVLPGVNITIKGTTIGTITDVEGNYTLMIPDSIDARLVASFIGMEDQELETGNKVKVNVQMEDDLVALSEVVVIGYGSQREVTDDTYVRPTPAGGWSDFKKYIKNNLRYPSDTTRVKGKVVLEFDIAPNGDPTNFEILRSMGSFYDQEAIRLIKEGPVWSPARRNGTPEQDNVRVRIRFNR